MYTREEASQLRSRFWTSFGMYMRPLSNADGDTTNWLNYKTGIRYLHFRMDADTKRAIIAIECRHPDIELQQYYFEQFKLLKAMLEEELGEEWNWQLHVSDEDGKLFTRIYKELGEVNVFKEADWPAIISFLKPRMLALDRFWCLTKDSFE